MVKGEAKSAAKAFLILNAKDASMPDSFLKEVQAVISKTEDSGDAEQFIHL